MMKRSFIEEELERERRLRNKSPSDEPETADEYVSYTNLELSRLIAENERLNIEAKRKRAIWAVKNSYKGD